MSIDKLNERIEKDALSQAQKVEKEAQKEAKTLSESAKAEAESEKKKQLEEAAIEASLLKSSIIARAKLEAKDQLLEGKRKALDEAFNLAFDKLNKLDGLTYEEALLSLRKNYAIGNERAVDTKERGLILVDEKGAKIDLTFKSLIDHYREELEQEVYKVLMEKVDS